MGQVAWILASKGIKTWLLENDIDEKVCKWAAKIQPMRFNYSIITDNPSFKYQIDSI